MDDIDFFTPGARLALELECLLLDTRDTAAKSRWWDSAWEALEQWRQAVREMERAMMADDAKRHPLDVTPDSAVDEDMLCPYPVHGRPDSFPARACILAGECGCDNGAELSRALRLADEAAQSVICTEGHSPEPKRWTLTREQIEADPYLDDALAHLEWRGLAEARRAEDEVVVVFKEGR